MRYFVCLLLCTALTLQAAQPAAPVAPASPDIILPHRDIYRDAPDQAITLPAEGVKDHQLGHLRQGRKASVTLWANGRFHYYVIAPNDAVIAADTTATGGKTKLSFRATLTGDYTLRVKSAGSSRRGSYSYKLKK